MIDTHAHLQDVDFDEDRDALVKEIFESGVTSVVCIGTDRQSSVDAVALADKYAGIYAAVGLHPIDCVGAVEMEWIEPLAQSHKKVVAIGEFGLDYHYEGYDRDAQIVAFEYQLQLAKKLNLPYVIHMRDATEDTMEILNKWRVPKGILHCFGGDLALAKRGIDMGMMISFSGNVTFKKAIEIQEAAKNIPLEKMMIETDCPYLAPVPNRGKRNSPLNLKYTAQHIADLRQIPLQKLVEATTHNAKALFGI